MITWAAFWSVLGAVGLVVGLLVDLPALFRKVFKRTNDSSGSLSTSGNRPGTGAGTLVALASAELLLHHMPKTPTDPTEALGDVSLLGHDATGILDTVDVGTDSSDLQPSVDDIVDLLVP